MLQKNSNCFKIVDWILNNKFYFALTPARAIGMLVFLKVITNE